MKYLPFRLQYLIMSLTFFICSTGAAQKISYAGSWGKAGYTVKEKDAQHVTVIYSINEFTIGTRAVGNDSMQTVELPGYFLPNDAGAPDLPGGGRYIAIPQGSEAILHVKAVRTVSYSPVDLAPAPQIPLESDDRPLVYQKNDRIYSRNAFYPDHPVQLSQPTQLRGVDAVILGITPFRYNPVTKELIVLRDIEVEITFRGGNGHFGDDRLRSLWFDPILKDALLNGDALPDIDYGKRTAGWTRDDTGYEYLIVSPDGDEFQQWADSIRVFRTLQGIRSGVVTLSDIGGNTATLLENYFDNAYQTWTIPPVAVLLLGDYGTNMNNSIFSPLYDNYCVSDNIYADVNGDNLPDMVFARITANNASQLQTMVTKFLNYERHPPTNPDFYDHPITALGWQTDRWFQICSETIGGYFKHVQGKDPVRINEINDGDPNVDPWSTAPNTGQILTLFGPPGLGYIPASPTELGGWTGGNATMINNAINAGAFLLQHRDHGMETGWEEPSYHNQDIDGLINTDLTFVFSVNCLTGKFDWYGECFAEKFHRYTYNGQNSGALGLIGATETSYSFVNDTYVWGMYDNMWPDFMPLYGTTPASRGELPAFGNVAGKYFLQQSAWPYNTEDKEVTYHLFHHHGDAFLTLYSEVPQTLTVVHDPVLYSGNPFFVVNAPEGAFISLTVNGEIIGTGEGTGETVAIPIQPQMPSNIMLVTVTKQNCYRYVQSVNIIPPEGPYIIFDSYVIDDETGNNNGLMDYGESVMLTVTAKNVGLEEAQNVMVTIVSNDPYITIADGEENFGDITAGGQATAENAFTIAAASDIPDGHQVTFEMTATDSQDSTWVSYFTITGLAPFLQIGTMVVSDSVGNCNGRLDPGETAGIGITVSNSGHSDACDVQSLLTTTSPYLMVTGATYDLDTLTAGEDKEAMFDVAVNEGTPPGTAVDLTCEVLTDQMTVFKTFVAKVGLILEDWESGTFDNFLWTFGGNSPWTITTENPFEGMYCAKSGDIVNLQSSQLNLDYTVMDDDSLSFYRKVSSETSYDFLEFYIDSVLVDEWSGEKDWLRVTYPVTAGQHTFRWSYAKDISMTGGQDAAWVDYISFPQAPVTTVYAGPDQTICQGSTCQMNASATFYDSLMWVTSGTGTFDNDTILNPVYTPSEGDIDTGLVSNSLVVYGTDDDIKSDTMVITIRKMPVVYAGDSAALCPGESLTVTQAEAENYTLLSWTTSGDGTFDDPAILTPVYTPGMSDLLAGEVTLTLSATNEPCATVSNDLTLVINRLPAPVISGASVVCEHDEGVMYSTIQNEGHLYLWEVTGGTIQQSNDSSRIVVSWKDAGQGLVTLTETIAATGCHKTVTFPVTINPLPNPHITGEQQVCNHDSDMIYSTQYLYGNSYAWSVTGGIITAGHDTSIIKVTWLHPGDGLVALVQTNDHTGCYDSTTLGVKVKPLPVVDLGADTSICHNHLLTLNAGNPDAQSWIWSTGETTQTITVDSSAAGIGGTRVISVVVTGSNGCHASDTISVYFEDCSGLTENSRNHGITIFPNPNNGQFTLELDPVYNDVISIIITNTLGLNVFEERYIPVTGKTVRYFDLGDCDDGLYYIFIKGSRHESVKKIIINK